MRHAILARCLLTLGLLWSVHGQNGIAGDAPEIIDPSTIHRRVLCGYQGWFRCPGDPAGMGWVHWSRRSDRITPETLTFEMWPDMDEYAEDEKYLVPGFSYPDGTPASLFSSENPKTVQRHFEWMRDYGIHGVWLQHFVVDLPGGPHENRYESRMRVLDNVRKSAKETGRVWALSYDMAAMPNDKIYDTLTSDWKRLVDAGIPSDDRYLHENGKPVLMVWGFYRDQKITPEVANRIIDFLKTDSKYGVFLVGGCEWEWRTETLPGWAGFLRRFDAISPWNVGNWVRDASGLNWASTAYWKEDLEEAQRAGMLYLPVVYPGFSWDNLQRLSPGKSNIPRRDGAFFWKQFQDVADLGVEMAYVAMFDEVDEGTAIFKVSNTPPTQAHFVTNGNVPPDEYLWLTGQGTKMILGQLDPRTDQPRRKSGGK